MRTLVAGSLALALVTGGVRLAHADAAPPWAVGVTESQKAIAQQALAAGNALFLERKYSEALKQYTAAVAAWDHPAIRFNMVRCLIQLDKPVEASDNLKKALAYGAAPLEEAVYAEALSYEKLLANQIGDVGVSCKQHGVKLTLDGEAIAACPGSGSRRVKPGSHQLVGTKDGYLPNTTEIIVVGGDQRDVDIKLIPLEEAAHIEHRWPTWVPWVVFGGGFAVAGIGGAFELSASSQISAYDDAIARDCGQQSCAPAPYQRQLDKANLQGALGTSFLIAGGAVVATGVVMLYLNRGRHVLPKSIERVTPMVAPMQGGAAVLWSGSF